MQPYNPYQATAMQNPPQQPAHLPTTFQHSILPPAMAQGMPGGQAGEQQVAMHALTAGLRKMQSPSKHERENMNQEEVCTSDVLV